MARRILAVLFLAITVSLAQATTLIPMYLDDLTAASQTVVQGKVIGTRTEWDREHKWIYTIYTVVPSEYLKGGLGPSFELRIPGGERDGLELIVAGTPQFQTGQEAVIFVWTGPDGSHQVTGFEQGAVAVVSDAGGTKVAARGITLGTAAIERAAFSVAATPSFTSRTLPHMLEQIRASVARTRSRTVGQSGGAR